MSRVDTASLQSRSRSSSRRSSGSSSRNAAAAAAAALKHTAPALEGTWFSTGFYGHTRSKPRHDIDFQNTVRQRAMPRPPSDLETRFRVSMRQHPFSEHDNKHTYCNEGIYLGKGMGKKKVAGRSGKFKAEFLHWSGEPGRPTTLQRSQSSFGDYAPASTTKVWTLDDAGLRSAGSGRQRRLTAPARLYRPPEERADGGQMMLSNYQCSFGSRNAPRSGSATGGERSRPSTSSRSTALSTPAGMLSPQPTPFASRPASPPPPMSPAGRFHASTPIARLAASSPAADGVA